MIVKRGPSTREAWIERAGIDRIMCDSVVQSVAALNTTLTRAYSEKKTRAINWQWMQDPKCRRLMKTVLLIYTVRKLWCSCRVTSVLSGRKVHATHHKTVTGVVPICFAARCVMCHSNLCAKKFHFAVVVSCFELMCDQSQRQGSSSKVATHTKMQ